MSWTPSEITTAVKEILSPTMPVLGTILVALIAKGVKEMSDREEETGRDAQNATNEDMQSALIRQIVDMTIQINELKRELEKARSQERRHG